MEFGRGIVADQDKEAVLDSAGWLFAYEAVGAGECDVTSPRALRRPLAYPEAFDAQEGPWGERRLLFD